MYIFVASDRHGWIMKNEIVNHLKKSHTYSVEDLAPAHEGILDEISYAFFIASMVTEDPRNFGVFVSKTGNEVMIPMNRKKYVRASLCLSKEMAITSKKELDSNIIVIPSDVNTIDAPVDIIDTWLETKYDELNLDNQRKNLFFDI